MRGLSAVKRSRALLHPLRWQLAVPFAALLLASRLLEVGKATLLSSMPQRWVWVCNSCTCNCGACAAAATCRQPPFFLIYRLYTQLVELPLAVLLGGTVLSTLLAR